MTRSDILEKMIYPAMAELKECNGNLDALKPEPETLLYGPQAALDSLALVNLIVLLEERIELVASRAVRLVDARAMSRKNSPFRTAGTLADYMFEKLGGSA